MSVTVHVSEGILEGEVLENEYGSPYCSFKGIPYAEPPIGDLRFKAPRPARTWSGVREAKKFGPVCHQHNFPKITITGAEEDCLYLNVYTPDVKPKILSPVMFWIHGGGFMWGSGNDDWYGPEYLIRQGVVLVTFNYRLNAFGFLCLNTEDVPGNAGMKDQVAALRWVNKNIKYFGGDPDNITIFGESVGAGSVSFHLVSPMTKGLFKRAIAQSGTSTCWWSQAFEPRERAVLLAKQLGFFSEDDKELYEFFKKQPHDALIIAKSHVTLSAKSYEIPFGIVSEKLFGDNERFFNGDVTDALLNGIHADVEVMTGYTEDEGLLAIAVGDSLEKMVAQARFYREFFTPKLIKTYCSIGDQLEVGRLIEKFYFGNEVVSIENSEKLIKYLSMDFFVYGITFATKMFSKNNKVYFYKFTCKSELNCFGHLFGVDDIIRDRPIVCHCDDLAYLFKNKLLNNNIDKKSEAFQLVDRVTKLWSNFAKYGNPTPDDSLGVKWAPYTVDKEDYLDIGNTLVTGRAPEKNEVAFWESIFRRYLPQYTCA